MRPIRRLGSIALAALLLGSVAFSSGCVVVKPWERGRLATAVMSRAADAEEQAFEHTVLQARQGSGAGGTGIGAGCGCN